MHNNININVSGPVQPSSQYKTVVLKGNLPLAQQLTEPNTKYVIKHNFDLSDGAIVYEGWEIEGMGGNPSIIDGEEYWLTDYESGIAEPTTYTLVDDECFFVIDNHISEVKELTLQHEENAWIATKRRGYHARILSHYDSNAAITIPENVILEFDGGSLSNGNIIFNETIIRKNDGSPIFRNMLSFSGTIVGYVTPENAGFGTSYNCFDSLLSYLKSSNTILKINILSMDKDYDFTGVCLDAYEIDLNGHTLQLGGGGINKIKDPNGYFGIERKQKIEFLKKKIVGSSDTSSVVVRGSYGLDLYIGLFDGSIIFEPNNSNAIGIAYSTFKFIAVQVLIFRSAITDGWINENQFFLSRTTQFIVKNENGLLKQFDHNSIYGGCFEGNENLIRLEIGTNNCFYSPRLEIQQGYTSANKTGYIYLSNLTQKNKFYIKNYPREFLYDYGSGNVFIDSSIYYGRPLIVDALSLEDVKNEVPTKFMNIAPITETIDGVDKVVAFHNIDNRTKIGEYDAVDITYIYNSPYFEFTENFSIFAIIDFISKNDYAPALYYRLYDANMDDIVVRNNNTIRPCAEYLSARRTYTRIDGKYDGGTFVNPFVIIGPEKVGEHLGRRMVLNINRQIFTSLIRSGEDIADQVANVKYVSVHVIGRNWAHTQDARLLRLGFSVYEGSMNTYYLASEIATMDPSSEQAHFFDD